MLRNGRKPLFYWNFASCGSPLAGSRAYLGKSSSRIGACVHSAAFRRPIRALPAGILLCRNIYAATKPPVAIRRSLLVASFGVRYADGGGRTLGRLSRAADWSHF